MIFLNEKSDVRDAFDEIDFDSLEDKLYWAIDSLQEYATKSIYQDGSEGCCYEDNTCFVESTRDDMAKAIEKHIEEMQKMLETLKKIEPIL